MDKSQRAEMLADGVRTCLGSGERLTRLGEGLFRAGCFEDGSVIIGDDREVYKITPEPALWRLGDGTVRQDTSALWRRLEFAPENLKKVEEILYGAALAEGLGDRVETPDLSEEDRESVRARIRDALSPVLGPFFHPEAGFGLPDTESYRPAARLEVEDEEKLFADLFDIFYLSSQARPMANGRFGAETGSARGWSCFDFVGRTYGVVEFFKNEDSRGLAVYFFNPEERYGDEGLNACCLRCRQDEDGRLTLWEEIGRVKYPETMDSRRLIPEKVEAGRFLEILSSVLPYCVRSAYHKGPFREMIEEEMKEIIEPGELAGRIIPEAMAFLP